MASELKHTVKPSGGDFTTLDAAVDHIAASHADLVTADVYASIEIDGTWSSADTAAVSIPATILTSATCYLSIYTTAAARHDGKWDTGAYMLYVSNATALAIAAVNYCYVDGVQIGVHSPSSSGRYPISITGTFADGANSVRFSNCIAQGHGHASWTQNIFRCSATNLDFYAWNCIGYNCAALTGNRVFSMAPGTAGSSTLYSCTAIGGERAYSHSSGTTVAKNCYGGGSLSADYYGTITKTTCASSDSTGSAGLQSIPVSADTFVNVGAGTEDYHLAVGSALIGVGTDTSGDAAPMNFVVDIDGDART